MQRQGRCVTASELTEFVNREILTADENGQSRSKVSPWYIFKNKGIMSVLKLTAPQPVEEARINACTTENFANFFIKLENMMDQYPYDPELIINFDETTVVAERSKRTTRVFCDPELPVRPIAVVEPKQEHITLCCAITASGRALTPVFILKNKTVGVEASLRRYKFDCGPYGLASSTNGWQDSVRLININVYLIDFRELLPNG